MLRSYLILTWKVLMRRKFFTAISLFGISFTLMILLVVVAFFDHLQGPHKPESKIDRMLFAAFVRQKMAHNNGWMNTPLSAHFIDRYVRTLKTPEMVALTSVTENASAFTSGQQLKLDLRYTDANFWRMLDFDFLEGRGFTPAEVKNGTKLAIINEQTARTYFGKSTGVVGKDIEIDLVRLRIAGVVKNVPANRAYSYSDVWLPYTLSKDNFRDMRYSGTFMALILTHTVGELDQARREFNQVMRRVPVPNPREIEHVYVFADPILESFTRQAFGDWQDPSDDNNGVQRFLLIATILGLFFMSLPALNLINLNVTRIMERSSEIGVRKAFGASGKALVGQFLVENVILAVIGGVIGLLLAAGTLHLVNESGIIAYSQLALNWRVFIWALLLAIVFGIFSGVYPAWKMSRLHPITALRGQAAK